MMNQHQENKKNRISEYKESHKFTSDLGQQRVHVYLEDKNGFSPQSGEFTGRIKILSLDPKEWETMKNDLIEWNVEVIHSIEDAKKASVAIREAKKEVAKPAKKTKETK